MNSMDISDDLIQEDEQMLLERNLLLGGKAYPKSGNILILAGGSGSGKSFIMKNLIMFDGKEMNLDTLIEMIIACAKKNPNFRLAIEFKRFYGKKLADIDIGNSDDLNDLYEFITSRSSNNIVDSLGNTCLDWEDEKEAMFFAAQGSKSSPDLKQNLIFDTTMKNLRRPTIIAKRAINAGYDPKNIHIVWILTPFSNAVKQNATRSRKVHIDVLTRSHTGAAKTFADILSGKMNGLVDGDFWVIFNDTKNLEDIQKFQFKQSGHSPMSIKDVPQDILEKIIEYVPDMAKDNWSSNKQ